MDEIEVEMRRKGILSAFESMNKLKALREQQEKLLEKMKRALSHSFLWPEAYDEKLNPKISFKGGGIDSTHVLVLTSEPLQQTREIRFRASLPFGARNLQKPLDHPKATIKILDEEYQFIPVEVFRTVIDPYIKNVLSW